MFSFFSTPHSLLYNKFTTGRWVYLIIGEIAVSPIEVIAYLAVTAFIMPFLCMTVGYKLCLWFSISMYMCRHVLFLYSPNTQAPTHSRSIRANECATMQRYEHRLGNDRFVHFQTRGPQKNVKFPNEHNETVDFIAKQP